MPTEDGDKTTGQRTKIKNKIQRFIPRMRLKERKFFVWGGFLLRKDFPIFLPSKNAIKRYSNRLLYLNYRFVECLGAFRV